MVVEEEAIPDPFVVVAGVTPLNSSSESWGKIYSDCGVIIEEISGVLFGWVILVFPTKEVVWTFVVYTVGLVFAVVEMIVFWVENGEIGRLTTSGVKTALGVDETVFCVVDEMELLFVSTVEDWVLLLFNIVAEVVVMSLLFVVWALLLELIHNPLESKDVHGLFETEKPWEAAIWTQKVLIWMNSGPQPSILTVSL